MSKAENEGAAFLLLAHDQGSALYKSRFHPRRLKNSRGWKDQNPFTGVTGAADGMEARQGTRLIQEASSPFVFRARNLWSHQQISHNWSK